VAQLCQYSDRLKELHVKVFLISFGKREEAKIWLKETCPSFQLLLNRDRRVYLAYELSGAKWQGIKGESIQLGGDFVVKSDVRFLLVHPSKESTDRPKVSEMITLLEKDR
jgi:peroxiredoxin